MRGTPGPFGAGLQGSQGSIRLPFECQRCQDNRDERESEHNPELPGDIRPTLASGYTVDGIDGIAQR